MFLKPKETIKLKNYKGHVLNFNQNFWVSILDNFNIEKMGSLKSRRKL